MRHDWILDVLADLEVYATQNDLPGVARKVTEAMDELRREVALLQDQADPAIPCAKRTVN